MAEMETFDCLFCEMQITLSDDSQGSRRHYVCGRCGLISLTEEAADDFEGDKFSTSDKLAISTTLRGNWERSGKKLTGKPLTLDDLHQIVGQFRPLSPTDKMDHVLIRFEKLSKHVAATLEIDVRNDYPVYYCSGPSELQAVCELLIQTGFLRGIGNRNDNVLYAITANGYQRLREIAKPNRLSRQCFVAMWFGAEMKEVFDKAIKPAIEFVEVGDNEA